MTAQIWSEVSAQWMKACGKGTEAIAFPVLRSYDMGLLAFVDIDTGNGHPWTVCAEWRGRFVNPPMAGGDPAYDAAIYAGMPAPTPADPAAPLAYTIEHSSLQSVAYVQGGGVWVIRPTGGKGDRAYDVQRHHGGDESKPAFMRGIVSFYAPSIEAACARITGAA